MSAVWFFGTVVVVVLSLTFWPGDELPRPDQDPEWDDEHRKKCETWWSW